MQNCIHLSNFLTKHFPLQFYSMFSPYMKCAFEEPEIFTFSSLHCFSHIQRNIHFFVLLGWILDSSLIICLDFHVTFLEYTSGTRPRVAVTLSGDWLNDIVTLRSSTSLSLPARITRSPSPANGFRQSPLPNSARHAQNGTRHKCPIPTIHRLTIPCTDSPNALRAFSWIPTHNL
jgi:hypothetical protein